MEEFALLDALDKDILMHRDAHFGGNFSIMIQYYEKKGKGIREEFSLTRIAELADMEKKMGQDLSPLVFSDEDRKEVEKAKKAYQDLKDLYNVNTPESKIPKLIANLILSEDENPTEEIEAIIQEKEKITPFLIDLLHSEDFFNPLFPGYGEAPFLAARCLGKIGDKRAITTLFETINEQDFFNEEILLKALKEIGSPAKEFLIKQVQSLPITKDNERAALALIAFKDSEDVSKACLNTLDKINLKENPLLATFLILNCESLQTEEERKKILDLSSRKDFSNILDADIKMISKKWKS